MLRYHRNRFLLIRVCLSLSAGMLFLLAFGPSPLFAKDYRVTFIKEQYMEKPAEGQQPASIYHTWYVTSEVGDKLLVLKGDDSVKRGWLREFIKQFDQYLIQVPDAETGEFESSTIFSIDVARIHPIDQATIDRVKAEKKEADKSAKKGAKRPKARQ